MSGDFKQRLVQYAQTAVERASRAQSEAATSQYLVLPFFQFLGYDPLNPDEIIPEAHAAFSDKFKNRVDYAICKDGMPAIGVEVKRVGTINAGHMGELKGYFNAVPSIKLGVLTDGLTWRLYTDTGRENMMDDDPFVSIDLATVAEGRVTDHALDALEKLRREAFDPAFVGADARRRLYTAAYIAVLERMFSAPDEALARTLMDVAKVEGRRTARLMEEHTPIIRDAMQSLLDRKILERVGFADRADLVRVPPGAAVVTAPASADAVILTAQANTGGSPPLEPQVAEPASPPVTKDEDGVVTTEMEKEVFSYVCRRLPFLIDRDEGLYAKLDAIYMRDYKTRFTVCYKQDRSGRLFNFVEMTQSPRFRFEFPDAGATITTDDMREIDAPLLTAFMKRVAELG